MMNTISYLGIFFLCLLIIPTVMANRYLDIKMSRQVMISVIRMIIQLSIVGIYLQYIFDLNNEILNILYLLIMMVVATFSIARATGLQFRKLYLPLFVSMAVPNILMVIFFNAVVISLDNIFDARYVITIGGMLLGNVLNGDIIGLSTFYKGISENRNKFNYELSLGATRFQAMKPYLKDAISVSIKPTVASMATIGLVSLPGMMTGQILGGSVPVEAIMYQIAIMIAIYVIRYVNIFLAITLTQNSMFNRYDQLVYKLK